MSFVLYPKVVQREKRASLRRYQAMAIDVLFIPSTTLIRGVARVGFTKENGFDARIVLAKNKKMSRIRKSLSLLSLARAEVAGRHRRFRGRTRTNARDFVMRNC